MPDYARLVRELTTGMSEEKALLLVSHTYLIKISLLKLMLQEGSEK